MRLVNVMMDNVSRLTMLKRSILRHSGRKTSNCHAILHDESSSSESAALARFAASSPAVARERASVRA